MVDTDTRWSDSGYDCDHCGGEISQRKDYEDGQLVQLCYQCKSCGCQWTKEGDVLRVGNGRYCAEAQNARIEPAYSKLLSSLPVQITLAVVGVLTGVLILLRFGGIFLVRFAPFIFIGLIIFLIIRLGKQQEWW